MEFFDDLQYMLNSLYQVAVLSKPITIGFAIFLFIIFLVLLANQAKIEKLEKKLDEIKGLISEQGDK